MTPARIVAFLCFLVVLFSCMVSARQRGRGKNCPPVVGCDGRTDNLRWGKRSPTTIADIRNAAEMVLRRRRPYLQKDNSENLGGTKGTILSRYNRLRRKNYLR